MTTLTIQPSPEQHSESYWWGWLAAGCDPSRDFSVLSPALSPISPETCSLLALWSARRQYIPKSQIRQLRDMIWQAWNNLPKIWPSTRLQVGVLNKTSRDIFNKVDLLAAKPISHRLPVKSLLELLLNGAGSEKSLIHTLQPSQACQIICLGFAKYCWKIGPKPNFV